MGDAASLLRAIAVYGLERADYAASFPDRPLDDQDWSQLTIAAFHEKLSGLLLDAVEDGAFAATPDQADLAAAFAANWYERSTGVNRSLVRAHDVLHAGDIDYRVIKGPATALTLYGDCLRRPYVDADIVVRLADFARTIHLLDSQGWKRQQPEHRPGFSARFAQAVALWDGRAELDVHRMLVHPPAGDMLPIDVAFGLAPAHVELEGCALSVLQPSDALVHAAAHARFDHAGSRSLLAARDVVAAAAVVPASERERRAAAWGLGGIVSQVVKESRGQLGVPLGDAASAELGNRDRRLLERQLGDLRLGRLRSLHGGSAKLRYAFAEVCPSNDYLKFVGQSRGQRLRTMGRQLSRGRWRR